MSTRSFAQAAAAALLLAFAASACGSDSSSSGASPSTTIALATSTPAATGSSTPSGTGSGAVCTAREELRSSIDDLKNVDVVKNGTAGIQTALTNVKKSLQDVKASASSELQPQVKAFEDAVNQLEEALKNVSSGGVSAVVSAAKDVGTTGSTLLTSLQDVKC